MISTKIIAAIAWLFGPKALFIRSEQAQTRNGGLS